MGGFSIGCVRMRNRLVLAPMYRHTGLAFRLICREQGAALLKRPKRIREIIGAWQGLGNPVTAKIRSNPNVLQTIRLAKQIEKAGASCLHFLDFLAKKQI